MSAKLFVAAALLAAANAGTTTIKNSCAFPIYITPSQGGTDGDQVMKAPGESYSAPISGSAQDVKIMTTPGFCTNNCVQLEYSVDSNMNLLFYDLSNINTAGLGGFLEHGLALNNSDPSAQQVSCPGGSAKCTNTYYQWFENQNTFSSNPSSDLTMHLCNAVGSDFESAPSSKAPAPSSSAFVSPPQVTMATQVSQAPQVTSAPAAPSQEASPPEGLLGEDSDGNVFVMTVTQLHYVTARAEETPAPAPIERRHPHGHAHAHQHHV